MIFATHNNNSARTILLFQLSWRGSITTQILTTTNNQILISVNLHNNDPRKTEIQFTSTPIENYNIARTY